MWERSEFIRSDRKVTHIVQSPTPEAIKFYHRRLCWNKADQGFIDMIFFVLLFSFYFYFTQLVNKLAWLGFNSLVWLGPTG